MSPNRRFRRSLVDLAILGLLSGRSSFLDSRAQVILTAIINEHFVTGEPVGSKVLADRFANQTGMSSATIRNVMAGEEL